MRKVILISLLLMNSFALTMSPALKPASDSLVTIEDKVKRNEVTKEKALKDLKTLRSKINNVISSLEAMPSTPAPMPTVPTPAIPVPAVTAGQKIKYFDASGKIEQVDPKTIVAPNKKGALLITDSAKKALEGTELLQSLKRLGTEVTKIPLLKTFPYLIVVDYLGVGPERLLLGNRQKAILGPEDDKMDLFVKTKQNIYWCFIFNDMTHYNNDWHKYRNAQEGFLSGYHLMDIPDDSRIYKVFGCLIDKNAVGQDLLDFIKKAPGPQS